MKKKERYVGKTVEEILIIAKCPECGAKPVEIEDDIAGKKTGHLFSYKCGHGKSVRISIG